MKMKDVLAKGMHMCIYPEGTRNKSAEPLQPFHNGAFKLAIDSGKPILPAVLFNTAKVLPAGKGFYFWPVKVHMHFLPPVEVAGKTLEQLKTELFEIIRQHYVQHSSSLS
jgi:1-acyl-sn-glycerol-3-phosphate acyltransferase